MSSDERAFGENLSPEDYEDTNPVGNAERRHRHDPKKLIGGTSMQSIFRWIGFFAFLWLLLYVGSYAAAVYFPDESNKFLAINRDISELGGSLGRFIAPVLQLALLLFVLVLVAERLGWRSDWSRSPITALQGLSSSNNVQAFIAVVIILALAVAALGNLGNIGVLKDIALVVVGFYFGTRQRQKEIEDAVAAGAAASSQQSPAIETPSSNRSPSNS